MSAQYERIMSYSFAPRERMNEDWMDNKINIWRHGLKKKTKKTSDWMKLVTSSGRESWGVYEAMHKSVIGCGRRKDGLKR